MYIKYSDIILNVETVINDPGSTKSLFLIHGFTGSARDWSDIVHNIDKNYNIYMIDLPGHGKSESPEDIFLYSAISLSEQIKEILLNINSNENVIAGYSMGGRAALTFAVDNSSMLKGLVLESSSAGIDDAVLREERTANDETLASFIEQKSITEFIDYWMNLEIFNSQKRFSSGKLREIRENKIGNNKIGLSNSLRGFGTGTMPPLFNEIKNINTKTLLLSGELDTKFTLLNTNLAGLFRNAEHVIIKNAGHNTHLEEPQKFTSVLNKFLKEL